jgi:hypothetical protein
MIGVSALERDVVAEAAAGQLKGLGQHAAPQAEKVLR